MIVKVNSGSIMGLNAYPVEVEVDVSNGLPAFSVVGLPDTAIRESRDRIRSAIKNSGFHFPHSRITVNLSPASIKKEGVGFDLPVAIGILGASGIVGQEEIDKFVLSGELSLNGRLKPFRGALPIATFLKERFKTFIFPKDNAFEACNIKEISVYGATALKDVIDHMKGIKVLEPVICEEKNTTRAKMPTSFDFKDVKGQEHAKRALEVAACGGHNVLLLGPPGAGKSMLAKRFPAILPNLSPDEAIEVTNIYSIAGELKTSGLIKDRPIRMPHHTISYAAMTGGGSHPSPGEITLAHNGVLFLDELPEFHRDVLEALRQPLELGEITINRIKESCKYPSRFIFLAAMNACPCGYFTDKIRHCKCSSHQIQKYLAKVSGPLLDRIDIHLDVPRLSYQELSNKVDSESSQDIKKRVTKTRHIQLKRFKSKPIHLAPNACMSPKEIARFCTLSPEAEELLKSAIFELGISARAYDKILKVSRTIADMEGSSIIKSEHLSEANTYRVLDRNLWG